MELIVPRSLAPGETVQLRLQAYKSDGHLYDVTSTARFFTESGDIVAVTTSGVATALRAGEAVVSGVDYPNLNPRSAHEVVVVPTGTFRVIGQVVEDDSSRLPIGDVRVEADGVPATLTDIDGRYRLYGVSGHGRMSFSKQGYATKEVTLSISDHHIENQALTAVGPRDDASGTFQMSIEAAPECHGRIPDTFLTRQYRAAITQSGGQIQGVLSGATFAPGRFGGLNNVFSGVVQQMDLSLKFKYLGYYYENSSVIEIVGDHYFVIDGQARLTALGQSYRGLLAGALIVGDGNPLGGTAVTAGFCTSSSHRMTLTR